MLIGRENEKKQLLEALDSYESQFVAVYGRRRVGKTFLIRQTFNENFAFQHTGLAKGNKAEQLLEFQESLRKYGLKKSRKITSWQEAFHRLSDLLESKPEGKKVVFIDEMPWLDTPQSKFISALEHFWNGWANMRTDIVLIICGSATSWIVKKIILDYGGLHNRLTRKIQLKPFTLSECEEYCNARNLALSRKDIAEAYMVLGGIPYYWNYLKKEESLAQNIDEMLFAETAPLKMEYQALYASLFKNSASHIAVVEALAQKSAGMSRMELLETTRLTDNTAFAKVLEELEQSAMIRKYYPYDKKERGATYQLMDNFTLFYNRFVKSNTNNDGHFWSNNLSTSTHSTWAGLAFEQVCLQHIAQIKQALGISGVLSQVYSWRTQATASHDGAQIDLLIDRGDNVVNVCEMKFVNDVFAIDKDYDALLRRKVSVFKQATKARKSVHLTMVTTYGLSRNAYFGNVQSEVVLDDLFVDLR